MKNDFQIQSLDAKEFSEYFNWNDSELANIGAIRMIVDEKPGYPCRVSLEDAEIGEEVILLPYKHHNTNSPYQALGPIFVRKNARNAILEMNALPKMLNHRLLSIRGYDSHGILKEATVTEGTNLREILDNIFDNQEVSYIHIHNAKPGCYNCMAIRVVN